MTTDLATHTSPTHRSDIGSLVREMARCYLDAVAFYRDKMDLSPVDAETKAREPLSPEYQAQLLSGAPDQVSWYALSSLAEHDSVAALALWDHIRQEADFELASGHRAARAMEYDGRPWTRAQFLAIRTALRDEWKPANGMEALLIDMLAQTYTLYLEWMQLLYQRTHTEASLEQHQIKKKGKWDAPNPFRANLLDEASLMVGRWNRMYLRTLRQLRDLRRYTPTINVQNVGQLNIGQQQTNMATPATGEQQSSPQTQA